MPKPFEDLLAYLRKVHAVHEARELTDGELLKRFLTNREDAAFAVLVQRHGPMVFTVCRRVLGDAHAAEDCFQATFMVLVRRAASIRKNAPLAGWLYAVAQRIALKARAKSTARRSQESQLPVRSFAEPLDELSREEIRAALDEEIGRLPEKYRAPIVLCYFEGKSHDQAAKELGWPKNSLTRRIGRARELLHGRLLRRGITVSGGAVAAALTQKAVAAPIGAMLTLSTVKAAVSVASGEALAKVGLSTGAVALAEEAMKGIYMIKAKVVVFLMLLALTAAGGAGLAGYGKWTAKSAAPTKAAAPLPGFEAAPAREQDNEAEKLFRAMEKKIVAAKSLKVVFETESVQPSAVLKGKGTGQFSDGNKVHFELELGDQAGKIQTFLILSDGKQLSMRMADGTDMAGPLKPPARLNASSALVLARCGAFLGAMACPFMAAQDQKSDIDKLSRPSAFKLGVKEKIGQQEAQVIEYAVVLDFFPETKGKLGKAKLWIDPKTMLPLQLRLVVKDKDTQQEFIVTEVYSEFLLNPQLESKLFELPPLPGQDVEPPPVPKEKAGDPGKFIPAVSDLHGDPLPEGAVARLGTLRFRGGSDARVMGFLPGTNLLASKVPIRQTRNGGFWAIDFWDTNTGQCVRRLIVSTDRVTPWSSLALSPDGKLLFTLLPSLVDVASGQDLRRLNGFANRYSTVAFAPDGRSVAAAAYANKFNGTEQKTVLIWDVASGEVISKLENQGGVTTALAFSPDSKALASACGDKRLHVYEIATGKKLWEAEFQPGEWELEGIHDLCFSPDGAALATVGNDGVVRLRDGKSGKLVQALKEESNKFMAVAFSPSGKELACGGENGILHLWDWETGKKLRSWSAHVSRLNSVAYSADGKVIASEGNWDHAIRLWDAASGKPINPIGGHTGAVDGLQFAPDGKTLLSLGKDRRIIEWDLTTGRDFGRLNPGPLGPGGGGTLRVVSPDGKTVAVGSLPPTLGGNSDPDIRLMDAITGREVRTLTGKGDFVWSLCYSHSGTLLASSRADGISVWNAATGKQLQVLKASVSLLAFSPDDTLLASAREDKIRLWNLATGKELRSWPISLSHLSILDGFTFSPDGKLIAAADAGSYCVWAVSTGKELLRFGNQEIGKRNFQPTCISFSRSGRIFAVGGYRLADQTGKISDGGGRGFVHLWDIWSGEKIRDIEEPPAGVWSLAFAPGGRSLASGCDDSTILLWDLAGGSLDEKQKPAPPTAAELDSLWSDLAGSAANADKAIWALSRAGNQCTPLLGERLRPVAPADAQHVAKLISELGSDMFPMRQKALQALTDLGEAAEAALRKALGGNPPLEVRQRLEKILEKRDQDPVVIRRLRAIEVLEHIGTAPARKVLQTLATAAQHPPVAEAARAALKRIGI